MGSVRRRRHPPASSATNAATPYAASPGSRALPITVPTETGVRTNKPVSTQEAFGRVLVDLSRNDDVAPYLVTTAPDVATSTNLAGFINRVGVYSPTQRRSWSDDPVLKWAEGPSGQHIELGISEMNLFLLLGQLGLSWDISGQQLIPVGTVYDPFVCRGLDALIYAVYSGSRFVVAGTPSGVTLAPEGGAHQSTITASIGLELPGLTAVEPAYATALDWLLCDAFGRIAAGPAETHDGDAGSDTGAYYFRLTPVRSTRRRSRRPAGGSVTRCSVGRCWPGATSSSTDEPDWRRRTRPRRRSCTWSAPARCCPRSCRRQPSSPTRGSSRTSST